MGLMRVVVPEAEDLVGKVIDGRFEVIAKLGEGGMGAVYRANQTSIGREVALKVIDPALARDPANVKRFMREAKLASQLSHPNTVGVIEFGQDPNGLVYLVMELVRGITLHELLKRDGALSTDRIAHIGLQLIDGLEAAHAMSVVHRDLKLENVIVLEGSRDLVKILDFGLARSFTDANESLTAAGLIAGTPRYLAPEVMEGATPAPAQDIYALGVLLGELAINDSLFRGQTLEAIAMMKLRGLPASLDGVAPELRAILAGLLAPAPALRPHPAEIRASLTALERGGAGGPRRGRAVSPIALEPTGLTPLPTAPKVTTPPPLSPSAFEPPPIERAMKLEVEDEWKKEREARFAPTAKRQASSHFWTILTVVLLAALGAGAYWYVTQKHPVAGTHSVDKPSHR